jgi:hypothetical protein
MKQSYLKQLLIEASQPTCTPERRNKIHLELTQAALPDEIGTPQEGVTAVLDSMYVQTIENKPQYLPALFPLFALICAERPAQCWAADIDWSLVG